MAVPHFEVRRSSADMIELSFHGAVDAETVGACEREARAALSVAKPGHVRLLVDLAGLSEYTLEARDALTDLQESLAAKVSCTAYVADSAQRRGLALWVAHMVRDHSIRCFAHRDDATAWLRGFHGPVTAVRPLAGAGGAEGAADTDVDEAAG